MPGYNITISDSRISKQIYELQKAVARISNIGSGGGSGTVTNVSVGDLSPLFTAATSTPSTIASTTFTLASQNPNTFFAGPGSGLSATPTFRTLTSGDFPLSGVSANTYNNVVVNNKGIVTGGSNVAYITANQPITISGDFTGTGTTSISATLSTVNSNVGTFSNATVTVDAKGRILDVSEGTTVSSAGIVNVVTDYGADNTGVADATAAINNAINNGINYKIYLPSGTYLITAVYDKLVSGTNKQGIQLISGIELYGDGPGKTIIKLQNAASANTTDDYFFPVINGLSGVSNVKVHSLEINGNRANQGNYTTNPYTNPAGYYTDPAFRWSTPGVMFMNSDQNEVYNIYVHDSQLNGVYTYNSTSTYVHHCNLSSNGASGVTFQMNSDGIIENCLCTLNNSDQIRVDDCATGAITVIKNCTASFSGSNVDASNWFAGIFTGGTTINVLIDGCYIHDNSAYGIDTGSASSRLKFVNNTIEANGNGGIVTSGAAIINNNLLNNGKKTDGSHDTHSNYNPAAIVLNSAAGCTIVGNRAVNTTSSQIYFIKSWGGGGSTGFNTSTVIGNYIFGVADVAHLYDGDNGTNAIAQNKSLNGSSVEIGSTFMNNCSVLPDRYFTFNGSAATGDSVTTFRVGSISSNDGVCDVYNNSTNAKLLQFGGLALSLIGGYSLKGWSSTINIGSALSGTQTFQVSSTSGDCFFLGTAAIGTATADSKAALTISSITKGFLPPKMTTTNRDAITSPTEGLTIYNTTTHKLEVYDGTIWQACF